MRLELTRIWSLNTPLTRPYAIIRSLTKATSWSIHVLVCKNTMNKSSTKKYKFLRDRTHFNIYIYIYIYIYIRTFITLRQMPTYIYIYIYICGGGIPSRDIQIYQGSPRIVVANVPDCEAYSNPNHSVTFIFELILLGKALIPLSPGHWVK